MHQYRIALVLVLILTLAIAASIIFDKRSSLPVQVLAPSQLQTSPTVDQSKASIAANPVADDLKEIAQGDTKLVSSKQLHVTFNIPPDWKIDMITEHGGNPALVAHPRVLAGIGDFDGMEVIMSSKWPHDPKMYNDGTEPYVDGTRQGFDALRALASNTVEAGDPHWVITKVKNLLIDGNEVVEMNTRVAPDIATEPFNDEVIWIRKDSTNWYIEFTPSQEYQTQIEAFLSSVKID